MSTLLFVDDIFMDESINEIRLFRIIIYKFLSKATIMALYGKQPI
jgi:hypothetical protein